MMFSAIFCKGTTFFPHSTQFFSFPFTFSQVPHRRPTQGFHYLLESLFLNRKKWCTTCTACTRSKVAGGAWTCIFMHRCLHVYTFLTVSSCQVTVGKKVNAFFQKVNAFFQKVNAFLKKVVHFFRWGATLPKTHIYSFQHSPPLSVFETLSRPWQVQVVQAVQVVQHILVFQFPPL